MAPKAEEYGGHGTVSIVEELAVTYTSRVLWKSMLSSQLDL